MCPDKMFDSAAHYLRLYFQPHADSSPEIRNEP